MDNIARTAVYVAKKAEGVDPARAVDLALRAARQFPQSRTATEVLADPVARYDTGQPVIFSGGTKPSSRVSRLDEIGGFLGLPARRRIDVDDIKQRRADAVAQAAKDLASYEKRRRAAGQ